MRTINNGIEVIDAALGWYGTKVEQMIKLGDHYMVLCRITELDRKTEGKPLVYWSGYKTITDSK